MLLYLQSRLNLIRKNPIYSIIVFFAILIFGITAYNSHGYYHGDEHFQIIEFARVKLGLNSIHEVAWEYSAKIRPTLQSTIFIGVFKLLNTLNITDPYDQLFVLRLLTGLFAIFVIHLFIQQTKNEFKNLFHQHVYEFISYFLWFIPLLSVHFTSETVSALFLLLGVSIYLKHKTKSNYSILIGVFFGFSFLFRFQIAFALLGFVLWFFIVGKEKNKEFWKLTLGFILVFIFGVFIDSWFYGEYVFTSWNYLKENLLKNDAPSFGDSPWDYYLQSLIYLPYKFIGILIFISIFIITLFRFNNLFIWMIIPFVAFHHFIPHKEERFLFPMIFLFPIVMMQAYNFIYNVKTNKYVKNVFGSLLFVSIVLVNSIGVIAMSQKSAGLGRMEISKYIHDHYGDEKNNLIYTIWSNPYDPWQGLQSKFYCEKYMEFKFINELCDFNDSLIMNQANNFLVIRRIDRENIICKAVISSNHFVLLTESLPKWMQKLNEIYKQYPDKDIFELYIKK